MTSTTGTGLAAVPRLRRDAAINRDRILKAASELFAERGLDASLADIADRAGVGVGTIYRRFPDKDALVAALLDDKLALVTAVTQRAAQAPSGWEAFSTLMEQLVHLLATDRAVAEIMLSDHGAIHAPRALAHAKQPATEIIDRAHREGSLRPDVGFNDLPPVLAMLGGAVDFTSGTDPEVWRRYLHLVLNGLRARPKNPPLPVEALSDDQLETASQGWARRPGGGATGR